MMNFIVSGQPKLGHESWPPPTDDKVLSDRLYGQRGAKDKTRMEIKFEKIGNRLITYYHFSKLKDVTSSLTDEEKKMNPPADHGRKGSFFVMSLRMDGYYSTDFSKIYSLLEEMYESHVHGKVLKMSKEGYLVYQIMKLEDAKDIWENITSELKTRGENTFLKRTKPIPGDMSIKGTKTSDYFSVEDAEKNIESVLLQKGGAFVLSLDEMKARNERIKQQEKRSDDENTNVEKITQYEGDAFIKPTDNVQEPTSLSEEEKSNNEKINAAGKRFQNPSQKKDFVKSTWLPIALIALGFIDLWLCVSIIKMKGTVNSLADQIDSLTVQSSSSISKTEETQEDAADDNIDGEDAKITFLDLSQKNGDNTANVTDNTMRRGYTYIISAKTGEPHQRKHAKGTGQYVCDVGADKGINIQQDGNKCIITIIDATVNEIDINYKYKYRNEDKSFSRTINISQ